MIGAWIRLVVLSLIATMLALLHPVLPGPLAKGSGMAILIVVWLKANIILSDYLELRQAPRIRSGFLFGLSLFLIAATGLYLIG
ncbi:cytochrome C oxidase subunit IV family protein [Paracoccus aerodenitrificans]|uniref:cytochrome C oxidase subunit IV family protein n=1 Tax=Paracoccus aerodenitrificans TaxID=3017781 RepID=UPI0022F0F479|nr:cytochrome C oxidase subunit IV family protein [Paracoccus aerodenitrificans]WBU62775.1 nitric oxide reductase F protein [Paracoccus aerodenitrificans]